MYTKFADSCANIFQKNNIIKPEEREIYQHGIRLAASLIVNISTAIVCGFICGMPVESLVVLSYIMVMRAYSGGFHASSETKCYFISVIVIIINLVLSRVILNLGSYYATMIASFIAGAIIFLLSPVVHENRPLDDDEYPIFRKRARIIIIVLLTITTILFFLQIYNIAVTSSITIFFVGLSVLLGYIRQKMIKKRSA